MARRIPRPPSASMLAALLDLAAHGGQVPSRYWLGVQGGRRIHQNVINSMINRSWLEIAPHPVRGGLRPVQLTAAGVGVADRETPGPSDWRTVSVEAARLTAMAEYDERDGRAHRGIGTAPGGTLLDLVDQAVRLAYTAGHRQEHWAVAADRTLEVRREVRRRLAVVEDYHGTEASKIKSILDGSVPDGAP